MSRCSTLCGNLTRLLVASVLAASVTTACTCQDTEPSAQRRAIKLTAEQQQALEADRVRFNLKTPEDYAKEAYLAIDEDNVSAEFEALRGEIEAEIAAPSGVSSAAAGGVSASVPGAVSSGATPSVSP